MKTTDYESIMSKTVPGVDRFMKKTFSKVEISIEDEELLKKVSSGASLITCTHRSHCDYFLLGELLWKEKYFSNIRFAAGDNLTTLPILGQKFLNWGAFPVSRDRANDRNYILELCNQSVEMLEQKQNIIVFPEGGRSYKGEMLEIKQTLLGSGVLAQSRNPDKDFYFVPVAISYEQLPELLYFKTVEDGKKLRKDGKGWWDALKGNALYFGGDLYAFGKFLFAHRFHKNYGRVYVDIGKPILIREAADLITLFNPKAPNEFWGHRTALKQIAAQLRTTLLSLYRILPHHVVAYLIIKKGCSSKHSCFVAAEGIVDQIITAGLNTKTLSSLTTREIITQGLSLLSIMKGIRLHNDALETLNPDVISYYSQTLIPHLVEQQ